MKRASIFVTSKEIWICTSIQQQLNNIIFSFGSCGLKRTSIIIISLEVGIKAMIKTKLYKLNITNSTNVAVSSPFNIQDIAAIVPYSSNTTDVSLPEPVWSGRYARLIIYGAATPEFLANRTGTGATVAEWAIIQANGQSASVKTKRDVRTSRMLTRSYDWPVKAGFGGPGRI